MAARGYQAQRPLAVRQVRAGSARRQDLALFRRLLSHAVPGSHATRALTLPLSARLRGAMDAAPLHSLLEANCSLVLAEELLWDGWTLPLDPEGRQEASGPRRRRLLPWHTGCAQGPALGAPRTLRPAAPPASPLSPSPFSPVARSLLPLQHDLGPDRDLLAPECGRSPGGEAVPRVLQRHQVQRHA